MIKLLRLKLKNFPSVTKRDFILKIFGGEAAYRRYTREFLREMSRDKKVWPKPIQELMLDQ